MYMRILVGLGNPGEKYAGTRHNVGFWFAEAMREHLHLPAWSNLKKAQAWYTKSDEWLLIEPQTFMNNSGLAVRGVLDYYLKFDKMSAPARAALLKDLYVAHDDLDLHLGSGKLQFARGPKVHNGLRSTMEHLATDQFWHVRLGVDGRDPINRIVGRNYVLEDFLPVEKSQVTAMIDILISRVLNNRS